ncbi:MAG: MucR family transcriptional regulator [Pseudomonadota bacterium]
MTQSLEPDDIDAVDLLDMTTQIVSAFVSRNAMSVESLTDLIQDVHKTLSALNRETAAGSERVPAVPIDKSITPDHIICLEDGRKLKMLKRYLRSRYDLSPEEYRARWGLPADYPMVAPNYAKRRSEFAKQIGLGRKT